MENLGNRQWYYGKRRNERLYRLLPKRHWEYSYWHVPSQSWRFVYRRER